MYICSACLRHSAAACQSSSEAKLNKTIFLVCGLLRKNRIQRHREVFSLDAGSCIMGTKWFVLYMLSGFSLAVLSVCFLHNDQAELSRPALDKFHSSLDGSSTEKVWPVRVSLSTPQQSMNSNRLLLFPSFLFR